MRLFNRSSNNVTRRRRARGQSMVELAMALPLLILMLVAAVDMGRLLFIAITANSAARAGVQYGAQSVITASDTTGMVSAALQDGKDVSRLSATATYYCKCPDGSTPPKCGDNVCASGDQMLLRLLFAGAGKNAQLGVKTARRQNNVHVGRVGGGGGHQTQGAFYVGFAQYLFLGCVANQRQPAGVAVFRHLLRVVFHDDEGHGFTRQLACGAAPDASGAAENVVS